MKRFLIDKNFKKHIINNEKTKEIIQMKNKSDNVNYYYVVSKDNDKLVFSKVYQILIDKKIPLKTDVALTLKRKIKLSDIRRVKTDYYNAYQELLGELNKKKETKKQRLRKRIGKYALAAVLLVAIVGMVFISQTKEVSIIVNGIEQKTRTNQFFSSIFAKKVAEKNKFEDYKYSCSSDNIIENKSVIKISNLKEVKTTIKGKSTINKTYTDTLEEFIDEQEKALEKYKGKYSYFVKEFQNEAKHKSVYMHDISDLQLYLMSKKTKEKVVTTKHKTKYIDNSKLESGTLKVKQKGQDGKYIKKYETIYLNDKRFKTNVSISKVIKEKKDKIVMRGTKVVSASSSVWDRLAQCETGGRWHLNSGNGFYGGLQFSAPTWRTAAAKVGVSAAYAHEASKADQIKAAVWLQRNSGWGQWPHCSSKLGLR
ncbi:uncharacterized protein YabE (DUF348 family) [Bacilli bacterium PM5-3]|nr:uncharacterized protein YabE (DUF348 family) [Bacilli bacterium PM5-3]MDH6604035.1 uncharacterized protein YabE (DUF348 family) [Bacilli bacterium PM5-9]